MNSPTGLGIQIPYRWNKDLQLSYKGLRDNPEFPLRDAFMSAIGAMCVANMQCSSCGGEAVYPACESCEEGYQECYECNGNGTISCHNCDGEGHTYATCKDCYGTKELVCDECGGEKFITCEGCEGTGLTDDGKECEECNGKLGHTCESCDGDGVTYCGDCDSDGEVAVDCEECDGDGDTPCAECEDGTIECGECSGDYEEQDCYVCEGQGEASRVHERAGTYYMDPVKINRAAREKLIRETLPKLQPIIYNGQKFNWDKYKINFVSARKLNLKYFENRIFNKVTFFIIPTTNTTYLFLIDSLRPQVQPTTPRTLMAIYSNENNLEQMCNANWSDYGVTWQNIANAPLYNEAMIITTDIIIWKPYSMNYLLEPGDKL